MPRTATLLIVALLTAFGPAQDDPTKRIAETKVAYHRAIDQLRLEMGRCIEKKIEAVWKDISASRADRSRRAAPLESELVRLRSSRTGIPTSKALAKEAARYEQCAAEARAECRRLVKNAASVLHQVDRHRARAALADLDVYCPQCIDPAKFAAKMMIHVEGLRQESKRGKYDVTHQVRDDLAEIVRLGDAGQISAEDLTRRVRDLVPVIERSKPLNGGKNAGRRREMQAALDALRKFLGSPARVDTNVTCLLSAMSAVLRVSRAALAFR